MDLDAIQRAVKRAEDRVTKLGTIAAALETELGRVDQRLRPELALAAAEELRSEAEKRAVELLQEPSASDAPRRTIFDAIKTVLESESLYSRESYLRRADFADSTEAVKWTVGVLPRASSAELEGFMADAVATGNRALAAAVHREMTFRIGPTASEADRQTARRVAELLGKVATPEADAAKAIFARLRAAKAQLEHRFKYLGKRSEAAAARDRYALARTHGVSA